MMRAAGGTARGGAFRLPNTPVLVPVQRSSSALPPPAAAVPSSTSKPFSQPSRAAPRRRRSVASHAQATTVLLELGLAAAAAWVAARPQTDPNGSSECSTCGGTGKEECACRRWSDRDVGCRTCSYSGYAPCRSCGGGGTAVPVALTERKLAPEDIKRLQERQERDRRERR